MNGISYCLFHGKIKIINYIKTQGLHWYITKSTMMCSNEYVITHHDWFCNNEYILISIYSLLQNQPRCNHGWFCNKEYIVITKYIVNYCGDWSQWTLKSIPAMWYKEERRHDVMVRKMKSN